MNPSAALSSGAVSAVSAVPAELLDEVTAHEIRLQTAAEGNRRLAAELNTSRERLTAAAALPAAMMRSVHGVRDASAALDAASVPAGRIYTIEDIAKDPHYQARGMLEKVRMDDGTELSVPGVVPKLSRTPGGLRSLAPALGQDTDAVLTEMGLTAAQIQTLRERGVVA